MHQGSCLCESIRYEIDSDLRAIVNCHCQFCSKAHGAPFTTLLFMPFAGLRIVSGAELIARHHVERLRSDRCFCAKCGTRLYNHAPAAGMISLVVATLNDGPALRPVAHINTESQRSWYQINDGLPRFETMPGPTELGQLLSAAAVPERAPRAGG